MRSTREVENNLYANQKQAEHVQPFLSSSYSYKIVSYKTKAREDFSRAFEA